MEQRPKHTLDLNPKSKLTPAQGTLLVSEPFLPDQYFKRTVILLCEHNAEGSFGFVLNRYIDLGINDLIKDIPKLDTRISIGGPVRSNELYYIHTLGESITGSKHVTDGIYMGGDLDELCDMIRIAPAVADKVRFFVGYSGWSEGQLDAEMDGSSWLVARASKEHVMNAKNDELWGHTLKNMGRKFAPLANFPEDPSLN